MSPITFGSLASLLSLSSDPGTLDDGDFWLRSDEGRIRYRTNGKTIPNAPAAPIGYLGVQMWQRIQSGPANTIAATISKGYALPFMVPRIFSITDVAISTTVAASAGGVARLGLYQALTSGLPGALQYEIGTVVTTSISTGIVKALTTAQTVYPGLLYYFCIAPQVNTTTFRARSGDDTLLLGSGATPDLSGVNTALVSNAATFTGALPDPFGAVATNAVVGPQIVMRGN